ENQSRLEEVPQRARRRGPGDAELGHELGFTGESGARGIASREDVGLQRFADRPMLESPHASRRLSGSGCGVVMTASCAIGNDEIGGLPFAKVPNTSFNG